MKQEKWRQVFAEGEIANRNEKYEELYGQL
jgi:hypothetical protein